MGNVLLYNPTCEMAVANDTNSYMPPMHLRKFESDISPLMSFLGTGSDFIITDNDGYAGFSDFWEELGFSLPTKSGIHELSSSSNGIDNLQPWGWSKGVHRLFAPLKHKCSQHFLQFPVAQWSSEHRSFYSRKTSIAFHSKLKELSDTLQFISIPYQALTFNSISSLNTWMDANKTPFVLKTPWSSSGRGLYLVSSDAYKKRGQIWIQSRFRQQGEIIVEKWLDKIQDFSFQFYIHSDGRIDCSGINYFDTDREGRFWKEYLGELPTEKSSITDNYLPENWQAATGDVLSNTLKSCAFHQHYCGPVGIDGIIFKNETGQIKIQPCIEINFRNNMGLLNQQLHKRLHPSSKGIWQIKQFKQNEWNTFAIHQMRKSPIKKENGRIITGFLPLAPINNNQLFGAWADI